MEEGRIFALPIPPDAPHRTLRRGATQVEYVHGLLAIRRRVPRYNSTPQSSLTARQAPTVTPT